MDRTVTPSGGWQFYQPETGWRVPEPMSQTFASAVSLIAAHRRANPALSATAEVSTVEADLESYTRSRLRIATPAATATPAPGRRRSCCGG